MAFAWNDVNMFLAKLNLQTKLVQWDDLLVSMQRDNSLSLLRNKKKLFHLEVTLYLKHNHMFRITATAPKRFHEIKMK